MVRLRCPDAGVMPDFFPEQCDIVDAPGVQLVVGPHMEAMLFIDALEKLVHVRTLWRRMLPQLPSFEVFDVILTAREAIDAVF